MALAIKEEGILVKDPGFRILYFFIGNYYAYERLKLHDALESAKHTYE
jgi:hypothetical protein